jgi:Protein of unknown function (DUF2809)
MRITYAAIAVFLLFFALFLRKMWAYLPNYLNIWIGDYCWTMMVWFGFRALFPGVSREKTVVGLVLFSWSVELSQLWHTVWLDAFRSTWLGGLLIGHGFLWSDMVAYLAGILTGYWIEKKLFK